jgi:acyl carrier protein
LALLDLGASSTAPDPSPPRHEAGPALLEQLRQALPREREKMLLRHLQTQVAAVLRSQELPAILQPFTELGMDSLMSIELRRRLEKSLQIRLPATLAYDYSMVSRLARFLLTQIDIPSEPGAPAIPTPNENAADKNSDAGASAGSSLASATEGLLALESLLNEMKGY